MIQRGMKPTREDETPQIGEVLDVQTAQWICIQIECTRLRDEEEVTVGFYTEQNPDDTGSVYVWGYVTEEEWEAAFKALNASRIVKGKLVNAG